MATPAAHCLSVNAPDELSQWFEAFTDTAPRAHDEAFPAIAWNLGPVALPDFDDHKSASISHLARTAGSKLLPTRVEMAPISNWLVRIR